MTVRKSFSFFMSLITRKIIPLAFVAVIFIFIESAHAAATDVSLTFLETKTNFSRINISSVEGVSASQFNDMGDHAILSALRCANAITSGLEYGEWNRKFFSTYAVGAIASGCSNTQFYHYIDLKTTYYTTTTTNLSFMFNTSIANLPIVVYFLDENLDVQFLYTGNTSSSSLGDCTISNLEFTPNSLPDKCFNNQNGYPVVNTPTRFNFRMSDIKTVVLGQTKQLPLDRPFRYIAITNIRGTTGTVTSQINETRLSGVSLTANAFPNVTIDADSLTICRDKNETAANFQFTVNSEDAEDDTIYYATQAYEIFQSPFFYFEDFYKFNGDNCQLNGEFFRSKNFGSNTSTASQNDWSAGLALASINAGNDDFIFMSYDIGNNTGVCNGKLQVYDGVTNFDIIPDNPMPFASSLDYVFDFPIQNSQFKLIIRDNSYNQIINYTFGYANNNITYLVDDVLKYNAPYNAGEILSISIDADTRATDVNATFKHNFNTVNESSKDVIFQNIYYSSFQTVNAVPNNYWNLKTILIEGISSEIVPSFTTDKPNNATFTGYGINYLQFYVTDNVHLAKEEWDEVKFQVNVVSCDSYVQPALDQTTANALASIRSSLSSICKSLDGTNGLFLKGFSLCNVFMFLAVGMSIFFFIVAWIIFKNVIIGFMFYSGSILCESLFVPFDNTFIVIHGFIFVITIAMTIATAVIGDGQGSELK